MVSKETVFFDHLCCITVDAAEVVEQDSLFGNRTKLWFQKPFIFISLTVILIYKWVSLFLGHPVLLARHRKYVHDCISWSMGI